MKYTTAVIVLVLSLLFTTVYAGDTPTMTYSSPTIDWPDMTTTWDGAMIDIPKNNDEDETKYEVNLVIKYNAVSIEKAKEIIADAMKRYQDACVNKGDYKKAGEQGMVSTDGTGVLTLPDIDGGVTLTPMILQLGDNCFNSELEKVPCK